MDDLQDLDMPKYSKDIDTQENREKAFKVLQIIALKDPVFTTDEVAEELGKYLVKALLFLHEGYANITLDTMLDFMRLEKGNVDSIYINTINDVWYFRIILVSAFKHITFDNSYHPVYKCWINAIINKTLNLMSTMNGCTIAALKTLNHLLKKYHKFVFHTVDFHIYETLKMFLYNSNIAIRKLSRHILKRTISVMVAEKKNLLIDTLLENLLWEKSCYLIASYVIHTLSPTQVESIMPRLLQIVMTSLHYNNLSLPAEKLFTAAVSVVNVPCHVEVVIPLIRRWTFRNRNDLFINNVNKYILPTCIRHFRGNFYLHLREKPVNPKVFARAFYISISNGFLDAKDVQEDMEKLLHNPYQQVRHDVFRALCSVQRHSNQITQWRILKVYECFSFSLVDINDTLVHQDFKAFMRNTADYACEIIKTSPRADGIKLIDQLLRYLYQRCHISFSLFTEEAIGTAYELILIIDSTFQAESELANNAIECEFPQYVQFFYKNHMSHMQSYAQIILDNIVTNDQYFKKAFVALHTVLLEHLPLRDIENAFKNNTNLSCDPDFVSGQKFIDLVHLFVKRKCFESRTVNEISNQLREILSVQYCNLIMIKKLEGFKRNPLFSCLGAWNTLYTESVKPSDSSTSYVLGTSEGIINVILEIISHIENDLVVVDNKLYKCMEHALLNAIEIMNTVMRQWQYRQDFLKLCTTITKQIISKSNMKRPVMRAATFLQSICNRAVKFPAFFDEIVEESLDEALHANPEYQKIRKTPESRLILHSIAKAGTSKGRGRLCGIIIYMLGFLESKEEYKVAGAVASALNCLEILISDKTISNATLPYIGRIVKCCIEEFVKPEWVIRNACLQVFQSLVYRILGQAPSRENRPVSINEIFQCYPNLIPYFKERLTDPENVSQDTAVATLMFLTQSYSSAEIMETQRGRAILLTFLHMLAGIIKTHEQATGRHAASAYVALIPEDLIPSAIHKIVIYIKSNFESMSKNIFHNFIAVLKELKEKYFSGKTGVQIIEESLIHKAFNDLILSAKNFKKYRKYNLLSLLNLNTNVINKLRDETYSSFKAYYISGTARMRCYNNFYYIFETIDINELPGFLENCLNGRLSTTMLVRCIDSLSKRLQSEANFQDVLPDILSLILNNLFRFSIEKNQYLLTCYCNLVMFLVEHSSETINFSHKMRLSLKRSFSNARGIHYTVIYAAVLSKIDELDTHEKYLAHALLDIYGTCADTVIAEHQILLAMTLKYLLKAVDGRYKRKVLDIAFILLIADYSGEEASNFLVSILNVRCSDIEGIIKTVSDYKVIINYLGDHTETVSFLLDMAAILSKDTEIEAPIDSFYISDDNDFESRKKLMVHSIYIGFKAVFTEYTEQDFVAAILKRLNK